MIAVVGVTGAVAAVVGIAAALDVDDPVALALSLGAAACAVYAVYVRLVERRAVTELGPRGSAGELAIGLLLGALLCSATMIILWLAGACTIEAGHGWRALAPALLAGLGVSFFEEILFRAIGFRLVEERLGTTGALIISAVLFGLAHALNGMSLLHCAAVALEAGVLLAAAFLVTRRLWLPIGLHAAWNATQMGVFGTSAMGDQNRAFFATELHGPALLTGGTDGPDVSLVAIGLCVVAAAALLLLARRRGQWRRA